LDAWIVPADGEDVAIGQISDPKAEHRATEDALLLAGLVQWWLFTPVAVPSDAIVLWRAKSPMDPVKNTSLRLYVMVKLKPILL
jgi:hypothetical protein